MSIGKELKKGRKHFGYTLKELSKKTHFSVGYLSNIERDVTSPTLASLEILCNTLRMDLVELLRAERNSSPLLQKSERKQVYEDKDGVLENAVVDNDVYRLTAYTMNPDYREAIPLPACDTGAAICYLLSGRLEVEINGEVYQMAAGDTILINSNTPYSFRQLGTEQNTSLWFYLRGPRP